jgi:hypothetical protein
LPLVPCRSGAGNCPVSARGNQHFLLRGIHLAEAHRALDLEVVAHHVRGTLGHVGKDLVAHCRLGALERGHQRRRRHLAQQQLQALVVNFQEVLEDEHQIFDVSTQHFVLGPDRGHDLGFAAALHGVEDVGGSLETPDLCRFHALGIAGKLALHDRPELAQGLRLHTIQRGHAHHHVAAHAVGQVADHFGRLVRIQVGQHQRNDLRVLLGHHFRDCPALHPLQGFHTLAGMPKQHAVDQTPGLALAQALISILRM